MEKKMMLSTIFSTLIALLILQFLLVRKSRITPLATETICGDTNMVEELCGCLQWF
jgi:hypothetical protein